MGRRKKGRAVSGWLVLDKPYELGSTQAVGKVRWLFDAKKAGHAGTLDPLATGVLPIALGEATKTVPYVTDGGKAYRFTVAWGARTSTDDAEGEVIATSDTRPSAERNPGRAAAVHRHHRAGAARLLRHQDRRQTRLRRSSCRPRRRAGRT